MMRLTLAAGSDQAVEVGTLERESVFLRAGLYCETIRLAQFGEEPVIRPDLGLGTGRRRHFIRCGRRVKGEVVAGDRDHELDLFVWLQIIARFRRKDADFARLQRAAETYSRVVRIRHAKDQIGILIAGVENPFTLLSGRRQGSPGQQGGQQKTRPHVTLSRSSWSRTLERDPDVL